MNTYKTNDELQTLLNATEVIPPGYEVSIETGWSLHFGSGKHREQVFAYSAVSFLKSFFDTGRIIDRTDGRRAQRRNIALIATVPTGGYVYRTTPGPKGAVRYGWAQTEQGALDAIDRWVRRRFAHVTFAPLADAVVRRASRYDVEVTGLAESVVRFVPQTDEARAWFDEHVSSEAWQWLGNAICVDRRYAAALLSGLDTAGLRFHAAS